MVLQRLQRRLQRWQTTPQPVAAKYKPLAKKF
jgi:hypothetical protein